MVVSGTRGDEDRSYLEPIDGEILSTVMDRELAEARSLLRTSLRTNPGYAAVRAGDRSAHVSLVVAERPFGLTIWDRSDFSRAHGWASELAPVAKAIQVFLEESAASLADLAQSFPFLSTDPFVENIDPGVTIEGRWQAMLLESVPGIEEGAAERREYNNFLSPGFEIAELIRRASERPELRRRQPFTSLARFGLWQQFLNFDVPVARATDGGYKLVHYHGGELYADGSLSAVLDAWIERIAGWPASRLDGYWPEP